MGESGLGTLPQVYIYMIYLAVLYTYGYITIGLFQRKCTGTPYMISGASGDLCHLSEHRDLCHRLANPDTIIACLWETGKVELKWLNLACQINVDIFTYWCTRGVLRV